MKRRDPIALWTRKATINCASGMHGPISFGSTPGNIRCAACGKVLKQSKPKKEETRRVTTPNEKI